MPSQTTQSPRDKCCVIPLMWISGFIETERAGERVSKGDRVSVLQKEEFWR